MRLNPRSSLLSLFVFLVLSACLEDTSLTENLTSKVGRENLSGNSVTSSLAPGTAHPYYLFFKGVTNDLIHVSSSDNRTTWSSLYHLYGPDPGGKGKPRLSSLVPPAVTISNGKILISGTWSQPPGPAMPPFPGTPGFNDEIFVAYSPDGLNYTSGLVGSNYKTKKSPSLVVSGKRVYFLCWDLFESGNSLYLNH